MHKLKSYITAIAAACALTLGTAACQDHFDDPDPNEVPVATMTANTTIKEFKQLFWQESGNYCEPVYTKEYYTADPADREKYKTEGTHIIVKGRVESSDYAGNVFRCIVLQDRDENGEPWALNISVNSYNLYLYYRKGQEVYVDLTGLYAGKYRGLFQVGFPTFNSTINGDETSFLAPEMFSTHMELNGRPDVAAVDTVVVNGFGSLDTSTAGMQMWQSRLIRFKNVHFVPNEAVPTLSTYHENVTQVLEDAAGNTMDVRTSGYSNFYNTRLPEGNGDVVAILGYFQNLNGTGNWQLTLLDARSLIGFGQETPGTEDTPLTVDQAIGQVNEGATAAAWVKGYIVGTVAPEVTSVSSDADIQWTATPDLGNTVVLADDPECKTFSKCLVVNLPSGSALRQAAALRENPANYKKEIEILGVPAMVMDTYGLTTSGNAEDFRLEGYTPSTGEIPEGDGQKATPYNVPQVIAKAPADKENALESGVWVAGYIVGSCTDKSYDSAAFTADASSSTTNLLLGPTVSCTDRNQCIPVALPASIRNALNLQANPANLGKKLVIKGDIIKYFGVPGLKNCSEYVLDGAESPVDPPAGENSVKLLASDNENGFDGWTIQNVKLGTGLTDIWKWTAYNGKYYLNVTAFRSQGGDTESYAISPLIDLTAVTGVTAEFRSAAKFQTTLRELCGFVVREEGASTWTKVNIPAWPEPGAWTWASSGAMDLSAFAGKKVRVAFLYRGSAAGNDQWEISDLTISGNGGAITVDGSSKPDTPDQPGTPDKPDTPDQPSDQGGSEGVFNFADPTTLNPAYSEADQVADGTTGNFKIDVKGVTFTAGSAAIVNDGTGTAARLYHQSKGDWTYRFYKNTVTTVSVAAGYHITKIEFEPQTNTYTENLGKSTFSTGTVSGKTWTPTSATDKVTITPTATLGFSKITVHYAK